MQRRSSNQKHNQNNQLSQIDLPIFPTVSYSRDLGDGLFSSFSRNQSYNQVDNFLNNNNNNNLNNTSNTYLRSRSSRQESHNNLFAGFKQDKKNTIQIQHYETTQSSTLKQKYDQQSLEYAKYSFDDRIKLIIRRIAIKAYNIYKEREDHPFLSYSIQKMLSILAKKLFLNRFQLLFLQYVLQETKWKYQLDVISRHTQFFKSFLNSNENQESTTLFKQVQIYFLYCGYYSKKSLNELPAQNIYFEFLKTVCSKFKDKFNEWTQASQVMNIKINPKMLNNFFKRLSYFSDRDKEDIENYSLVVQEIIDISPAYNADKTGNKTKKIKKRKQKNQDKQKYGQWGYNSSNNKQKQEHQSSYNNDNLMSDLIKQQHDQDLNLNLSINSSNMGFGSGLPLQKIQSENDFADIPALRNKKQTSFMSLVDGVDPQAYMKNM